MALIYLDYETFSIQPGLLAPPPVCAVVAVDDGPPELLPAWGQELWQLLDQHLDSATFVAHHAPFEWVVTAAARTDWIPRLLRAAEEGRWRCTLVREKLVRVARGDARDGFALDDCLEYWKLPIELDKDSYWRPRYGLLWGVPVAEWPKEAVDYVVGDIAVRDLYLAQSAGQPSALEDETRQVCAAIALQLTSCWGFPTDEEAARRLESQTLAKLEEAKKTLQEHELIRRQKKAGEMVWVKDQKAAVQRMAHAFSALGKEPPRGEPTEKMVEKGIFEGNIKLDAEACEESQDPVLEAYSLFANATTLLSKVRRLQRPLIQTSYDVLKSTGRTSSRQGKDPKPGEPWSAYGANVQNLPRAGEDGDLGPRECFVAPPGHAIVSVDYDAFEMRTWAQICHGLFGYSALREILNDTKRCPHVEMGAAIEGLSVEEAYALKATDKDRFKELRSVAKGPNFGLPGGMGAARLVDYCWVGYRVRLTEARAAEIIRIWKQVYPEAQAYLDWISEHFPRKKAPDDRPRTKITQFGSRRIRGRVTYTEAANGYFQALAADIAKDAGWRLAKEAYGQPSSPLYGCRPLAFVHDEWLYAVPLDRLTEAGHRMAHVMTATAMEWCPDVLFTASPAAMLRWSKKAGDPVYDRDGNLVPWERRS